MRRWWTLRLLGFALLSFGLTSSVEVPGDIASEIGMQTADAKKKKKRKKRSRRKKRAPAAAPAPPPPAPASSDLVPSTSFRGPTRLDFDDRLIQGQTNKSGAVYLFDRKETGIRSMVRRRKSFRQLTLQTVYDR